MSFSTLRHRLPALPLGGGEPSTPWPRVGRGGASFSDDLARPGGGRLGVRVRITDREGGGYCIDLRDSDEPDDAGRFGLGRAEVLTASVLALGHALGEAPSLAWGERIELLLDSGTWVGMTMVDAIDPAALAFGMARTFDAVLGALANAWPGRVGAGSCSVGAIVELREGERVVLTEVLPGGEGGRPDRPGASAWAGPVLASTWGQPSAVEGITLEGTLREGSGGMGKQAGGDGVTRRYLVQPTVQRPLFARLAFDRVRNPPHGIDRAGPPAGTEVWLHQPGEDRPLTVEPWSTLELTAGATLEVLTCGGAGWGFPGYGEIEWDPSEWFGSTPKGS